MRIKNVKPQGKILIAAVLVAAGMGIAYKAGLFEPAAATQSAVPEDVALPTSQDAVAATHAQHGAVMMPGNAVVTTGTPVRYLGFAWNSQMGLMFANGGPVTTQGSLMATAGVKLTIARQDDCSLMQAAVVDCARELSQGAENCNSGAQFVAIMGDGGASFLRALNGTLSSLPGDGMVAEIVASAGYSRGEDRFMGPPAWRDHPEQAKGGLVAGVLRDGDWNLALYWAGQNEICNNPDPETFDPDCLNWVGTSTYLEPVEKYNANACETRPVVSHGRRTGESRRVCVQGVVTWTPGDVNVVHGRGGLVSIISTKENATQMPNAIIGIRKWNRGHRELLTRMVAAIGRGGQAVMDSPAALSRAATISDTVYHETGTGPTYWSLYFHGTSEQDSVTGETVQLGGSKVNNIGDMQALFGLLPGTTNSFQATYTAFGNVMVAQYPHDMPDFPAFASVSDSSYIRAAAETVTGEVAEAPVFTNTESQGATRILGNRNWTIEFRSGSAEFTPETLATLEDLRDQLLVASSAYVDIHGHTDSTGNPAANQALSLARAQAVANWLRSQSEMSFPSERVHTYGHGSSNPIDSANTPEARARNRRVTIELRTQS